MYAYVCEAFRNSQNYNYIILLLFMVAGVIIHYNAIILINTFHNMSYYIALLFTLCYIMLYYVMLCYNILW